MKIDFDKSGGLVPAIVQDAGTGRVLMLAMMDSAAWQRTVETGLATFFSRSRGKLWIKGENSGHVLKVVEARTDCDQDTVLLSVEAVGPGVCHEGYESCFFRRLENGGWTIDQERQFDPAVVYGGSV